uniref:EF-hand domain (C-terminal) containing 1 n=2 Tax=Erpetoichthys calabaricus TaxID=27687 RepID=A0A8C4RSN6_ERPCA
MTSNACHGQLPFLPGNSFRDLTKTLHGRPQTLKYKNGYAVPQRPLVGIGREPLLVDQFTQSELDQMNRQRAILTYGPARTHPLPDFIP